MDPITSILFCPLARRDNPSAARRMARFAAFHQADVTVLGVIPERSRFSELVHGRDAPNDLVMEAERHLAEQKIDRCSPPGSRAKVVVGSTALAIVQEALIGSHDLVVVSCDDTDQATVRRLLRKCPCPVWVIRPSRAKIHRLLAAVNPDPSEAGLNHSVLELSLRMNEVFGGELHVVHAWELYGEATMRASGFVRASAAELRAMAARERAVHHQALDDLVHEEALEGDWNVHLLKGQAASVVPDLVKRRRINLLVMGTVARSGLSGLVMGNTAERILDDVRCSVIAVKPPGFVSPIGR